MEKRKPNRLPLIILVIIVIFAVVYVFYRPPSGEGSPPASKNPGEAAEQGLSILEKLITDENFAVMGFESVEEASAANLGEPMPVFYVPLDRLKAFEPGSDVESLLVDNERVFYPVTVSGEVRSSIVVSGSDEDWRATEYGRPNLMKGINQFREGGEEFIVWVPALNLYFVGFRSDEVLFLRITQTDDRFKFRAGATLDAAEVFIRIQPAAEELEDIPTS